MHLPKSKSLSPFTLWALLAFLLASVTSALDLSTQKTNLGPLGVQLDWNLAKYGMTQPKVMKTAVQPPRKTGSGSQALANAAGSGQYVWSTRLEFKKPVAQITDGQLVEMLYHAWDEFQANAGEYDFGALPRGMTIMAFGREVLLSTTIKAKSFTVRYPYTPVSAMLTECARNSAGNEDKYHQNGGNCGEIATAHQFFLSRQANQVEQYDVARAKRLFNIIRPREITLYKYLNGKMELIPPCGTERENGLGCNRFVHDYSINYLNDKTARETYNLATLAGGLVSGYPKQQSLCRPAPARASTTRSSTHTTTAHRTSSGKIASTKPAHKTSMHPTSMHTKVVNKSVPTKSVHKTSRHPTSMHTKVATKPTPTKPVHKTSRHPTSMRTKVASKQAPTKPAKTKPTPKKKN